MGRKRHDKKSSQEQLAQGPTYAAEVSAKTVSKQRTEKIANES